MRTELRLSANAAAILLVVAHAAHAAPPQAPAAGTAPTPTTATAPPAQPAAAPPARNATVREAEQHLSSADPNAIRQALDDLGKFGTESAVAAINARVRRGLWPELTEHAISTLVQIRKPSAGPVLLELALHRRPSVRAKAIAALGALNIRSAQSSLLYALDDPSPEVRDAAVSALGVIGTARALPALFAAAERGAEHAFESIGAIASTRDLKTIFAHVQSGNMARALPALRALLARANFPQQGKLTVIDQLSELGSPNARALLAEALEQHKKDANPRLRKALMDAVARFDAAASAAPSAPTAVVAQGGKP